jgi:hypothetical protein
VAGFSVQMAVVDNLTMEKGGAIVIYVSSGPAFIYYRQKNRKAI